MARAARAGHAGPGQALRALAVRGHAGRGAGRGARRHGAAGARAQPRRRLLLAFEQLGAADAALEMAAACARERRAFGRTIGSYQGIKHKLADLYNANQLARVHCYYGAWAITADVAPGRRARTRRCRRLGRVSATLAATQAAHEGCTCTAAWATWEVDCHLFMRRARQQAVLLGHEHAWRGAARRRARGAARGTAAAAPAASRPAAETGSMDFDDSPAEATFRAGVGPAERQRPPKPRADAPFGPDLTPAQRMQAARDWQARKARAGFGAITWPRAVGGRGGTPIQELIWRQEEGRFDVPTGVFNVSLGMVMPAVLAHACDEVRARAHRAGAQRRAPVVPAAERTRRGFGPRHGAYPCRALHRWPRGLAAERPEAGPRSRSSRNMAWCWRGPTPAGPSSKA